MGWLSSLVERLRAIFGKSSLDAEMEEELRFHLEKETEKNLRSGMSHGEARRRAMVAFGGVERFKERTREERGIRLLEDLTADVRFARRTLGKSPVFALVAVLSLALGIGANTAVFSVADALLVRDLPFRAPQELVNVYRDRGRGAFDPLSYPDFLEIQEGTREVFSDLGGFEYAPAQREMGSSVETVLVEMVTGSYMPLLGVRAALGRGILPEDHIAPGAHPVVVLGHRYWEREFGGEPGVVGQSILLNGLSFTVVGVAPESFQGSIRGVAADLFAPIMMIDALMPAGGNPLRSRGTNAFMAVGRLREGATLAQARATLDGVAERLKAIFPGNWDRTDGFRALPASQVLVHPAADRTVVLVNILALGVVALVLLVACANLAAFLLARGIDRKKEVALRLALGATRGRLVRQLLTETMVLAVAGGAVGVPLALWVLDLAMRTTLPIPVPLGLDLRLDLTILGFTVSVSVATGVMVGLLPALQATRPKLAPALKEEGRASRALALGRLLVSGQMALSVVLLVVAGLFIRSFTASRLLDPGFGREPTAVLTFMVPARQYPPEEGHILLRSILEEARALPEVTRVAAVSNIHLNPLNSMFLDVNVDGVLAPTGRGAHVVDFTSVSEGFFAAAGIPLLEGRDFDASDREGGLAVAVVNEAMADRFWPGGDAIGRTIEVEVPGWEDRIVVGVAATAKIHALGEEPTPFIYLPFSQEWNALVSVLAVSADPRSTANALFRMARERHPELIVAGAGTLEEHVGVMLIFSRLSALLSSVFAALALGLSLMGLCGVVGHAVARDAREMAIRQSLGADSASVVALQFRRGLRSAVLGGAVGLPAAWAAARAMEGLLVGVSSTDPLTFVGVAAFLGAVASLAAYLPARRASRTDPLSALRAE